MSTTVYGIGGNASVGRELASSSSPRGQGIQRQLPPELCHISCMLHILRACEICFYCCFYSTFMLLLLLCLWFIIIIIIIAVVVFYFDCRSIHIHNHNLSFAGGRDKARLHAGARHIGGTDSAFPRLYLSNGISDSCEGALWRFGMCCQ